MERGRKLEKQIRKIRRITEWPSNECTESKLKGNLQRKRKNTTTIAIKRRESVK